MIYDDINIYEENGWKDQYDLTLRLHKNFVSYFIKLFEDSHTHYHFLSHGGYLLFLPK